MSPKSFSDQKNSEFSPIKQGDGMISVTQIPDMNKNDG